MMNLGPVRSNASFKWDRLYTKTSLLGVKRHLVSKGSLLPPIWCQFLKIITPLDPGNSKNSKSTIFCARVILPLLQPSFLTKTSLNWVPSPTYCKHWIPCLMLTYRFIWKYLKLCTILLNKVISKFLQINASLKG